MGTNYYLYINICPHCKKEDERIHLGKKSWGWAFSVQGFKYLDFFGKAANDFIEHALNYYSITEWKTWKDILKNMPKSWIIKDEEDREVTVKDFIKLVESSYKVKKNLKHAIECPSERDYLDDDGYSISEGDFS